MKAGKFDHFTMIASLYVRIIIDQYKISIKFQLIEGKS